MAVAKAFAVAVSLVLVWMAFLSSTEQVVVALN
jgi:hypothetical protein